MKLQVKYNELNELGTKVEKNKKDIDDILDNVKKLIDEVPLGWSGEDSEVFINKANETIANEKERNNKIEILSNILIYAAKNYKDEDEGWVEVIKKEEINS